jgi:hypothetical protein
MNPAFFVRQSATNRILEYVSRFCAECYREFREEETIYYDMERCCYLCSECAEKVEGKTDMENVLPDRKTGGGLF